MTPDQHAAGLLHARTSRFRRLVAETRELIRGHLDAAPGSYVSWSGGKDSTAVCILTGTVDHTIPMVRRSRGVDFPEVVDHCASLAATHGWTYHVARGDDAASYLARLAEPDEWGIPRYLDHRRSVSRTKHLDEAEAAIGRPVDGWLYGLRPDESRDRARLLYGTRGRWVSATGHHVCAPLWRWTIADVYALHAAADVPLCAVYDRLSALGVTQRDQRVGYMVGGGGATRGRYRALRRGWPEQWGRLVQLAPWLLDVA